MKKLNKNFDKDSFLRFLIFGIIAVALGIYIIYLVLNSIDWILTTIPILIGVILFFVGMFCIACAIEEIYKSYPTKKNVAKWEVKEKYEQEGINEDNIIIRNYENKLTELSTKYGDITANITYCFESGWQFRKIEKSFIVFENSSTLFIVNKPYSFNDIISYEVVDDSKIIYSGNSNSNISTSNKSMIGRAAVGGALLGGTGALIGGITANKQSNTSLNISQTTNHKYEVIITLNNLSEPIIKIELEDNRNAMEKISSVLSIIISRNQK